MRTRLCFRMLQFAIAFRILAVVVKQAIQCMHRLPIQCRLPVKTGAEARRDMTLLHSQIRALGADKRTMHHHSYSHPPPPDKA